MKLTKSKLKEMIREEIRILKEKKEEVELDDGIEYILDGKKITIIFPRSSFKENDIQQWLMGNDDRVGDTIDDSLEDRGLQLDWSKKTKDSGHTIQMFVKKG